MNQVILRFGLREPKYFGLSFIDEDSIPSWLDPEKSLKHQLGCEKFTTWLSLHIV